MGIENDNLDQFTDMLSQLDNLLGLKLSEVEDITPEAKELIKKREEFRNNKEWDAADKIRNQLDKMNIALEDKSSGPQWRWNDHA